MMDVDDIVSTVVQKYKIDKQETCEKAVLLY